MSGQNGAVQMEIGGLQFSHICIIAPERAQDGAIVQYLPQRRYLNQRGLPLHRYGNGPFCKFKILGNHRVSGVYAYFVDGALSYIGRCEDLSSRINMGYGTISPRNCFSGGQQSNCRMNTLIYPACSANSTVDLYFHATPDFVQVEALLISAMRPPWNR